jgi:purine-binding chemotaxis protein CheW
MMPACMRGVINLRGAVVPVIDLAGALRPRQRPVTKRSCIVIVELEQDGEWQTIGVVVDAVNAVLEIASADIEPAPEFRRAHPRDFIQGMGKVKGKFVILLNVSQALSLGELGELAAAASEPAAS